MAETAAADLIAACGEATAVPFFICRPRDTMLANATGRRILHGRPRITSASLDLAYLGALPDGTAGREYARWLDRDAVSPDTLACWPPFPFPCLCPPLYPAPSLAMTDGREENRSDTWMTKNAPTCCSATARATTSTTR